MNVTGNYAIKKLYSTVMVMMLSIKMEMFKIGYFTNTAAPELNILNTTNLGSNIFTGHAFVLQSERLKYLNVIPYLLIWSLR